MKDFFSSLRFKIIVGIVALLLGLIIYEASSGGYSSAPSSIVGAVLSPFQSISAKISGAASDFFGNFINVSEYKAENARLKNELAELQEKLAEAQKDVIENDELKIMLGISEQNPEFVLENASVIGRDTSSLYAGFTINKGSLAGILPNSPVITSDGLIGKVVEVGALSSRVITLLSPENGVAAVCNKTLEVGPVVGTDEYAQNGRTAMRYLSRETGVTAGDIIQTSGSGGVYPAGLIIGVVEELKIETHGISTLAVIAPAVDAGAIKNCFVIKSFAGQGR